MSSMSVVVDQVAAFPTQKQDGLSRISENGLEVLRRRYLRKGLDGKAIETVSEMFWRVASNVALPERTYGDDAAYLQLAERFYDLLTELRFFPNSPTFTGAGTPLGQLAACFVLAIDDDMGKDSSEGIFNTLRNAALIQQTGGGNGFSFSRLRPKSDPVNSSAGVASGPVGFLRVYDAAFGEIAQGGCLTPDTLVFTDHGALRLDELVDREQAGWQEHRLYVATDEGDRPSPRGYNNGVQPVLTVNTQAGLTLTGTFNHKVKVMTEQGPAWRRLDELQAGDAVLVMLGQHQGRLRALRRPASQAATAFPALLDETLAFLLGYTAGDEAATANATPARAGWRVARDSYLTQELSHLLTQIFPDSAPHLLPSTDASLLLVTADYPAIRHFLAFNGLLQATNDGVGVPKLVRQSPPAVVGAFLRGLFEAAGSLTADGYPQFSVAAERLAREAATLLIGLGCPVAVSEDAGHWTVRVTTFTGLSAWREQVGCDRRSRLAGAYTYRADEQHDDYVLPYATYWLQPVLDEAAAELAPAAAASGHRADDLLLRRKLLPYVTGKSPLTGHVYRQLHATSPRFAELARPASRLWFVEVTGSASAGEALTLDLEVADNHTYLANGLVTHNTRRGANMGVLRVDHPDIEEFIACKAQEGAISNFNISVGITDAFMEAVREDSDFDLVNPHTGKVSRTVRARSLFDQIVAYAHRNGEPGVLFLDAANRFNPVPHLYELEATNPCGEQFLGPYENCCLGSINLAQHVTPQGTIDWAALQQTTVESTRFLDDVVDANKYVPAVPQLQDAAHRVRRIGLGIMGLADVMYKIGVRYGDRESLDLAGQVMEFVRFHCMKTSIELAQARGPFPAITGSIYDPANLLWQPPAPLEPATHDFGRPAVDWSEIVDGIKAHGIRNGAQTTVAPTGCLVAGSLVATDQGLLPIETLGDSSGERWQAIDLQVASEGGPAWATQFYLNGRAHTLRAVTRRGYTLQGTDQHRIRVWQNGGWEWRRMDELQPGMRVPLQVSGLIGEAQAVALNCEFATEFHPTPVTLPVAMSAELAYLVGFFMGDGSLKDRSLRFAVSDAASEAKLTDLIRQLFNAEVKVASDTRSKTLKSIELHSVNVVNFWRANGFAKEPPHPHHRGKGYRPAIPLAVLRSNDAAIYGAFLAGLFDADGTIHQDHLVTWLTTDQLFHDQVKALLLALGVLTTSDLQTTGLGQSVSYRLRTAHAEAAQKLLTHLPQLCRLHADPSAVRRPTLGDTIPLTQPEYSSLLSLANAGQEEQRVWSWRQRNLQASRASLADFVVEHRREVMAAGLDHLVTAIEDGVFYDELVAVEDGGWQETYDLSVPGPHAYLANGFVSHNTIGTVTGCEGYGCEPVFALAYTRYVKEAGGDVALTYVSPLFLEALERAGISGERRERIVEQIVVSGTCQGVEELPAALQHTFVVSQDIAPEQHVLMQAALQRYVDNSISKTVNFPEGATPADVKTAYLLGWELGCKGLTVYVTGSRQEVVLETKATAEAKKATTDAASNGKVAAEALAATVPMSPPPAVNGNGAHHSAVDYDLKRPRPRRLHGATYRRLTPLGTAYVTVNDTEEGEPFEVFMNVGKAGSDVAAVSEALGRLISLMLRMPGSLTPTERLQQVVYQLNGIGGGRHLGFGPQRVRSLPDAIAQVLSEHLEQTPAPQPAAAAVPAEQLALPMPKQIGDLCPDCGNSTLLNIEGCVKCHVCGYSEC
ncbi:MAG: ribonucleotide reductase N-terminal alpha domain-containing protein [Anaerolineae bacterium]